MLNKILNSGLVLCLFGSLVLVGCKAKQETPPETSLPTIPGSKTGAEVERNFVALGSSLTRASNLSTTKQGEHEEYSFSVGTQIESVYLHLKNQGENLTPVNLASPGAETRDILERQVPQVVSYEPRYVTIDPGADLVDGLSVAQFKQNLTQIIDRLQSTDDVVIMMFTYPNFPKMRSASYSSCKGNKLGLSLESLTEENIKAFNQAMQEVAAEKGVILVDIYDLLGPGDVSDYDCLHTNIEAQKKIAQEFIKVLDSR